MAKVVRATAIAATVIDTGARPILGRARGLGECQSGILRWEFVLGAVFVQLLRPLKRWRYTKL